MKLHLGCGQVYLDGWKNVDAPSEKTLRLPEDGQEAFELREDLKTTEEGYYARQGDRLAALKAGKAVPPAADGYKVVDLAADLRNLPLPPECADEILAVQVVEHFAMTDRRRVLDHWMSLLKPGGRIRITVPDTDGCKETILACLGAKKDGFFTPEMGRFALRHLLGSRRDPYSYHFSAFTRDGLQAYLESLGFVDVYDLENFHDYPAVCLGAFRPREEMARHEYQDAIWGGWGLPPYPKAKVLDVGGGKRHHPRANMVLDLDGSVRTEAEKHCRFTEGTVLDLPFKDNEYDFAICSHLLEHLETAADIERAASELSRVAKAGYVETPSYAGEVFTGMFAVETGHHWFAEMRGQVMHFRPITGDDRATVTRRYEAAMSRVLRLAKNPSRDERIVRQHYWRNQKAFNAMLHWRGELRVEVDA